MLSNSKSLKYDKMKELFEKIYAGRDTRQCVCRLNHKKKFDKLYAEVVKIENKEARFLYG